MARTLGQQLDRDVYQAIRRIADDAERHAEPFAPTVASIYDRLGRSNSSLSRRPRKLLEASIERALDLLQDAETDDKARSEPEQRESAPSPSKNGMNAAIVGAWQTRPPKRRKVSHPPPTHPTLADLGGLDDVIQQLEDLLVLPLLQPGIYTASGIQPPRGILLHGPPGCGKTMLAHALAAELGVPFLSLAAPSIVSGMSGESEKALRERFEEATRMAPCLMFIDEIDAITPKRESAQREMEKRIVAQLLTCMDDLALTKTGGQAVIVLAATNRPDSLDPALRRGGRFDREIHLTVPDAHTREQILRTLARPMECGSIDWAALAAATPGFVGADLRDLVSTAGALAVHRRLAAFKQQAPTIEAADVSPAVQGLRQLVQHARQATLETVAVDDADFHAARARVQPSSLREGFAVIPDTTWADVGALNQVRDELRVAIVEPIRHPARYARVGITAPTGVLLWGPPGCGKTLLAQAVAHESKANFISIKGPELLNKYVGESERAVRQVFLRARSSVPCVIFFDELDALVPMRDDSRSEAAARVVNTLLTELDGLDRRAGIYVVGATNRPDMIDPAMLRPGRLETLLFVDLPGPEERVAILQTLVRRLSLAFPLDDVARSCNGFSGADLASLVRRAGYGAIERDDDLKLEDFERARTQVQPSVPDRTPYERLRRRWER